MSERVAQMERQAETLAGDAASGQALAELRASLEELLVAGEPMGQQQDALARVRAETEAERQRYAHVFDLASEGYLVTNPDGKDTLAYREHERAFREQKPVNFETYLPERKIWIEVNVYPSASGLSAPFRDITARKDAEQALLALVAAHEGLEATVRERTADLAHANQRLEAEIAARKRVEDERRVALAVAKYAKANRVSVLLSRTSDHVLLIVEDNGKGFDMGEMTRTDGGGAAGKKKSDAATAVKTTGSATKSDHPHLGLLGMRERVALVGGTLDIESSPDQGTTLYVRLTVSTGGQVVTQ